MDFFEFIERLANIIKENQILATALGLGGAGTIIMWLKGIPVGLYNLLKREFTTEMTVTNQHVIFYDILKLIKIKYHDKKFRRLKLLNGRWGEDDVILSMGYGTHFFFYKKRPLWITLTKEEANQTTGDKDNISFLKLGRNYKLFSEFITEAELLQEDKNTNKIYKMSSHWEFMKNQVKRGLESVFIEKDKKDLLVKSLDSFIGREQWYLSKGIPYQFGILLYGPPGTGKTSLIKAIASYLSYSIYYLPTAELSKIERAAADLPDKCIMIIEDIDSNPLTKTREESNKRDIDDEGDLVTAFKSFEKIGLSEVLNAMDGLFSAHGRILIATTNHLETLDPALIRPGRIDLKVEIGYVNIETLELFINSFFPNHKLNLSNISIKDKVTIAELQNFVLQGFDENQILEVIKT